MHYSHIGDVFRVTVLKERLHNCTKPASHHCFLQLFFFDNDSVLSSYEKLVPLVKDNSKLKAEIAKIKEVMSSQCQDPICNWDENEWTQ